MAPWPRSATTAAGCTPTPTLRACACCAARSNTDTASGASPGSPMRNCAVSPRPAEAAPAADPPPRTPLDTAALTAALQQYDAMAIDQQITRLAAVLPSARTSPGRVDAGAGAGGRRMAPPADAHRAGTPDVVDDAEHARRVSPAVRAARRCRPACSLRPPPASATRSRRSARPCWRRAAGWASLTSAPDLPAREIVESVEPAGAQVLVLRLDDGHRRRKARERELRTIVRELPKERRAVGGRTRRGASRRDHPAREGLVLPDYNAYQQELVRIGGRVA